MHAQITVTPQPTKDDLRRAAFAAWVVFRPEEVHTTIITGEKGVIFLGNVSKEPADVLKFTNALATIWVNQNIGGALQVAYSNVVAEACWEPAPAKEESTHE